MECVIFTVLIQVTQLIFCCPLFITNKPAGADGNVTHRSLCARDIWVMGIWKAKGAVSQKKKKYGDLSGHTLSLNYIWASLNCNQTTKYTVSSILLLCSKKESVFLFKISGIEILDKGRQRKIAGAKFSTLRKGKNQQHLLMLTMLACSSCD